jgi:hypothetical protein
MDPEARSALVYRLQERVAENLPVYTLYHPRMCCVYRPEKLDTWFFTRGGVGIGIPIEMNNLVFIEEAEAAAAAPSSRPASTPEQSGFELIVAIAGLLAVAYLVSRGKW